MRRYRCVPFLLLGGALLAAVGAPGQDPAAPPAAPGPEDADAVLLLDRAAQALGPGRITWLACDIRQEVDLPGLRYTGEGSYRLAPGHRFRLEVRTHVGDAEGTLLLLGDGVNVWQARRAGEDGWEGVTRVGLAQVLAGLEAGPAGAAQLRAEFLQGPTLSGVVPLLRTLRYRLLWVGHEARRAGEAEVYELIGAWRPEEVRARVPADRPWPAGLPRRCRVVLDARTLWPQRVEWWGPAMQGRPRPAGGADALLAVTEYRNPRANVPFTAEECARAFAFDPGKAPVTDRTGEVSADLAARLQEMAGAGP
jgi:hypothetical protein